MSIDGSCRIRFGCVGWMACKWLPSDLSPLVVVGNMHGRGKFGVKTHLMVAIISRIRNYNVQMYLNALNSHVVKSAVHSSKNSYSYSVAICFADIDNFRVRGVKSACNTCRFCCRFVAVNFIPGW